MSEMDAGGETAADETTSEEISIETPEADAAEQRRLLHEEGPQWPVEVPLEVDPADAAEQHRLLHEEGPQWPVDVPLEVDPADATEQDRTVELDEDDYR